MIFNIYNMLLFRAILLHQKSTTAYAEPERGYFLYMGSIITISNQKGGVGKTSTTAALSGAFAKRKYRVLAIDLDPQGNLTFSLGGDSELSATCYHILKGEIKPSFAIQHLPCCDLIAANILLSGIELEVTGEGREYLLRKALDPLRHYYDYVLIDTPPALSILTVNAFTASDYVLVPVLTDIFSLQGITQLHETVSTVRKYCNPELKYAGILLTRYDARTTLAAEVRGTAEMIGKDFGIPMLKTSIRSSIAVCEAPSVQRNLLDYAPHCNASKDYLALVDELIAKGV